MTVRDTTAPQISLNGSDEIIHPVGESYTDAGASATDIGDQNPQVTVSGTVNTEVLGNYVLTYTATDASGNQSQSVRREVSVVDITAPTIQAVVANKVSKNWNFDAASGDEFPYVTSTQGPSVVMGSWVTDGLVAHYPFNGDASDASGNGNNGVISGVGLTTIALIRPMEPLRSRPRTSMWRSRPAVRRWTNWPEIPTR